MSAPHANSGGLTAAEVASQPAVWRRSLDLVRQGRALLAAPGERVLLIGCGTSAFVARALADLREAAGAGETHWSYASELPRGRSYDRVIALTRSGTTTEVLEALAGLPAGTRRVGVCAVAGMPVEDLVDDTLLLDFADESSVVQTRFPTATVVLFRAALGEDVEPLIAAGEAALQAPAGVDPAGFEQFVFLSRGWGIGLADEAALKIRESAQAWAESYPALDYRHGPIAIASPRSLVTFLGPPPSGLVAQVEATGATVISTGADPLIDLVGVHRLALALAASKGLDPDRPHNLQRSVILPEAL